MGNVMVIPAKWQVGNTARQQDAKPKLRVAAYCRVSTDSDEQATSYDAQVEHYTEFIQKKTEWEFAGIYADDGISGTNTKKREDFNRMIDDCEAGNIDMIITKSISRFARNTLDCLKYIRQLKDKNIPVFFEKEAINTMDAKGEVLITIMASLAQQESQSLSQNVKLGLKFRYQNGQVQVNHNHFLGYTKDADGNLIIDPEQAEVAKSAPTAATTALLGLSFAANVAKCSAESTGTIEAANPSSGAASVGWSRPGRNATQEPSMRRYWRMW